MIIKMIHMIIKTTLKSHFCCKNVKLLSIMYATSIWTSQRFPKTCKPTSCLSILLHDVISILGTASYDNVNE